jgi:UrcA family protein
MRRGLDKKAATERRQTMLNSRTAPLFLIACGLATPVAARDVDVDTVVIRVPRPSDTTPDAMRRLRGRISEAALEACGLTPGSLAEVKSAIRRSDCWRKGYNGARAQIGVRDGALDVASHSRLLLPGKP